MGPPRLLGVFAHPDDEVFCAGGTLAMYVDEGVEAMVVSATRGEAGQIRDARLATRRTLGAVREEEFREACRILGVQQAVCLDHPDGRLAEVDRPALVAEIGQIIEGFGPDAVITFGADGAYGHPDHVAISEATTAAYLAAQETTPHEPNARRLYHSHFPRSRLLMLDRLADWLVEANTRTGGGIDFVNALTLFAEESSTLGFVSDHIDVQWYPPGVYILEQGEPPSSLYLILSGEVEVFREDEDGATHFLDRLGTGQFFGELGIAHRAPRAAHVVAADSVTCLIFSPGDPTAFASRGAEQAGQAARFAQADDQGDGTGATTVIDVSAYVDQKVAAIAANASQFTFRPDMFPRPLLVEMMGREYFLRIDPPVEPERSLLP